MPEISVATREGPTLDLTACVTRKFHDLLMDDPSGNVYVEERTTVPSAFTS
jgi:hypothetical protein